MPNQPLRRLGAAWGAVGVAVVVVTGVYKLSQPAAVLLDGSLTVWQWLLLIMWLAYMLYKAGIRGFGRSFSPRVIARAQYVASYGRWHHIVLAPLFCFGYYQADRRTTIATYGLTSGIIVLALVVRLLDQPWRGMIDSGVVLALTFGLGSLVYFAYRAWVKADYIADPQMNQSQ